MNDKKQDLVKKTQQILVDSFGYWPSLQEALDDKLFELIAEAFVDLANAENNGKASNFGNSLARIFEVFVLKTDEKGSELDRKAMKEILTQYNVKKDFSLPKGEEKEMISFWEDSQKVIAPHKIKDFYKTNWRPFLNILDFHFNLELSPADMRFNPFEAETFEEIKELIETWSLEFQEANANDNEIFESSEPIQLENIIDEEAEIVFPTGKKYWGIDLGTNNSAISYYVEPGVYGTIKFDNRESISSAVAIDEDGNAYPLTNYNFRGITAAQGREGETIAAGWKVIAMNDEKANKPLYPDNEKWKHITPVFLSSLVLKKLLNEAEKQTKEKIDNLIITVPASFNEIGIENTKAALRMIPEYKELADSKSMLTFKEPVAAMLSTLANNLNQENNGKEIKGSLFAVFDMGAGTTDISVLRKERVLSQIKDIKNALKLKLKLYGNSAKNLAGRKIDEMIVDEYISPVIQEATGQSIQDIVSLKKDDIERLKEQEYWLKFAEEIKEFLSSNQDDYSEFRPVIINGVTKIIEISIVYDEFKMKVKELISEVMLKIEEVLKKAKKDVSDVDYFILAGGSAQAPWVRELIVEDYPELENKISNVNPQNAISLGAAVFGEINQDVWRSIVVNNDDDMNKSGIELSTITLSNYGVTQYRDDIHWIVDSGTDIPTNSPAEWYSFKGQSEPDEIVFEIVEADKKYPWKYMAKLICRFEAKNRHIGGGFWLKLSKTTEGFYAEVIQGEHKDVYTVSPLEMSFRKKLETFASTAANKINDAKIALKNLKRNEINDVFKETVANFLEENNGNLNNDIIKTLAEMIDNKKYLTDVEKMLIVMFLEEYNV